jgi:hypothetical protein
MALAPCRECGRQVSTEAATCPHCGVGRPARQIATPSVPNYPSPDPKKRSAVRAAFIGIGIAIVIAIVQSGSTTSSSSSGSTRGGSADSPVSGPGHINQSSAIWKAEAAMDRGVKLIVRGVHKTNPEMLLPLVACFVKAGEAVTVIGGGFTYREVVASSGPRRVAPAAPPWSS